MQFFFSFGNGGYARISINVVLCKIQNLLTRKSTDRENKRLAIAHLNLRNMLSAEASAGLGFMVLWFHGSWTHTSLQNVGMRAEFHLATPWSAGHSFILQEQTLLRNVGVCCAQS